MRAALDRPPPRAHTIRHRPGEQVILHPASAFFKQRLIFCRRIPFAEIAAHFRGGFQRRQIETGQPGIGAEQFHIERVVLPAVQDAGLLHVPLESGELALADIDQQFAGMGDRNAKQINNLVPLTSVNGTGVATVVVTIPAARLLTTGFWRRGQKGGECEGQAGTVFTAGRRASVYPSCVRS